MQRDKKPCVPIARISLDSHDNFTLHAVVPLACNERQEKTIPEKAYRNT